MNKDRRAENPRVKQIKRILAERVAGALDDDGYFDRPEQNLLPGIHMHQFEKDLRAGGGHELRCKFCAAHSSSALAVNAFALFKDKPGALSVLGKQGCDCLEFEKRLPTGLGGTPPHLDVFVRRRGEALAIESKFLEYFTPQEAKFSASYARAALPWADDCWWQVLKDSKEAGKRLVDVAQLVKHYFGISRLFVEGDEAGWKPTKATLLYLFWEPENATDIEVCRHHRNEIEELNSHVSRSKVLFRWLSYPELWQEWSKNASLADHASNLLRRYTVRAV